MTPTLIHFVYSLPPAGAAARLGSGPAPMMAPTLIHFVYSLPPEGAAARLGSGPAPNWP